MVLVSGILSLARSGANGPKWTHNGPQNGPQFLKDFWGSYYVLASDFFARRLALATLINAILQALILQFFAGSSAFVAHVRT